MLRVGSDHRWRRSLRLGRVLAVSLVGLMLLAASFIGVMALDAPPAAAEDECDFVAQPVDRFEVEDDAGTWFINWTVADVTATQVDLLRRVSVAGAENRNFSTESVARITSYFDAIEAWFAYLDDPCADARSYPGPFGVQPTAPPAPYGFGGIDARAVTQVVTGFIDAEEASSDSAAADDGSGGDVDDGGDRDGDRIVPIFNERGATPALANSGSESFVLAYFGAGLLAFGATALGMRRWVSGAVED
ncbi:MAG: hypothetical protein AAF567_17010 [Actinomycetota bacterium]